MSGTHGDILADMYTQVTKRISFIAVLGLVFLMHSSIASAATTTCPGRPDVTLTWSSTNPSLCTGGFTGDWGGVAACSFTPNAGGNKTIANGNSCVVTYNCIKTGGQVLTSQQDALVYDPTKIWNGSACVVPAVTLTSSADTIVPGDPITLTWSCPAGTTSTGVGFSTGGALSGSVILNPAQTATYRVTCDSFLKDVTVTVNQHPVSISANPTRVNGAGTGGSSTISWTSSGATSCLISGPNGFSSTSKNNPSGTVANGITTQSTYTINCNGMKKTAIVNVSAGFVQF